MNYSEESLPKGWVLTTIDEIMAPQANGRNLHQGWSPQCEGTPAKSIQEWGVLKTTAIQDGDFLPEYNKRLPKALTPRPDIEVKEGDILITCAGPRIRCGVPCLVRKTRPKLMLSGKMYRFRVQEDFVSSKYIELYLRYTKSQAIIDKMKTGGSDSGLNLTHSRFRTLPVRLPPFSEQQRIVDKVEQLFSEIEKSIEYLVRAQQQLKVYRLSLLKKAFQGILTKNWRKQNQSRNDSSDPFVDIETLKTTDGEITNLSIPPEWRWVKLSSLLTFGPRNGFSPKPAKNVTNIKSLTLTATTSGKFDPAHFKYVDFKIETTSHLWLNDGDLLIQRGNTIEYVGTAAVYRGPSHQFIYPDLMMKLVPSDRVLVEYLELILNSPWIRQFLRDRATGTAGSMPKINKPTVESIPVPLCEKKEQQVLVDLLREKFSVCDYLETTISDTIASAVSLKHSILNLAFEGKLEKQNSKDEPAEILLRRLKAAQSITNRSNLNSKISKKRK